MKPISAIAALSIVGLLACEPVLQPEVNSPDFARVGGVVESVTGGGNFTDNMGDFRSFTVSAQKFVDGSVTGQWERVNHRGDGSESETKSHGVVTCFNTIGGSVRMGGFATSGRFSTPPNNGVRWHLVDNGPGATDRNSLQFVGQSPGRVARSCAGTLGLPALNDVTQGQITVR